MALTKLTKNLIDGTFGTEWDSTIQTSNFTAVAGKGYFVNTTSGQITVTLPAGVVGNEITIQDYAGTFATNKVIFAANGSEKIQGSANDYRCVTNFATCTLIYQDSTKGWTADNIEEDVLPPLVVDYLVCAGGGAGATNEGTGGVGGGGAGGLRTSYGSTSGGGASAESSVTLTAATNYTVTIGAGGAGSTSYTGATDGSDTIFSTITSAGGGKGGTGTGQGSTGGSGGGSGRNYTSAGGAGTANQGYAGGAGGSLGGGNTGAGGGGGGAGSVGAAGVSGSNGGNGGDGLSVAITGTGTFYAGGAGGGTSSGTGGTGGSSIGGAGGVNGAGASAAANTASGGGGCGGIGAGGNGGSGIVILRYPADYTLTNPGAGLTLSTATDGSSKVTTFTAGTGNIQLNG